MDDTSYLRLLHPDSKHTRVLRVTRSRSPFLLRGYDLFPRPSSPQSLGHCCLGLRRWYPFFQQRKVVFPAMPLPYTESPRQLPVAAARTVKR